MGNLSNTPPSPPTATIQKVAPLSHEKQIQLGLNPHKWLSDLSYPLHRTDNKPFCLCILSITWGTGLSGIEPTTTQVTGDPATRENLVTPARESRPLYHMRNQWIWPGIESGTSGGGRHSICTMLTWQLTRRKPSCQRVTLSIKWGKGLTRNWIRDLWGDRRSILSTVHCTLTLHHSAIDLGNGVHSYQLDNLLSSTSSLRSSVWPFNSCCNWKSKFFQQDTDTGQLGNMKHQKYCRCFCLWTL
jgi:hypothetical protein